MNKVRSRVVLLALLAIPTSIAALGACVGEVINANGSDAGGAGDGIATGDGTTGGDASGDTAMGDGGLEDTGTSMDADDGAPCNLAAPFGPPENVAELNSTADDTWPRISADGKMLYFSRNTAGGNFYDTMDLYRATRGVASGPFGAPAQVANLNSSPTGDVSLTVTADGVTIYFDSYRAGTRHIFFSVATAGNFATPAITSGGTTSGAEDYNPFVLPSNGALYFASARGGASQGSSNLWRANRIDDAGGFGVAEEEATLNAYDKDESPVVTADDRTIYFSTDRLADGGTSTYGSFDIYVAHRTAANLPWNAPVRVNEISTNNADYPGSITTDGCTLYFMSDRQDIAPQGKFDIFRATRGK